jgi:hypothetical protein
MAPPVVRHATPPSTNSKGARVQRVSTLTIQEGGATSPGPFTRDFRGNHHTEGADGSEDYIDFEGVKLQRENGDSETVRFIWKRETSSRIDRHVPWVEKARLKLQRLRGDMRSYGKISLL